MLQLIEEILVQRFSDLIMSAVQVLILRTNTVSVHICTFLFSFELLAACHQLPPAATRRGCAETLVDASGT